MKCDSQCTCSRLDKSPFLCCQTTSAETRNRHSTCEHTRTSDLQPNTSIQSHNDCCECSIKHMLKNTVQYKVSYISYINKKDYF